MPIRIDQDRDRFHKIVRGKVRDNLKQFIQNGKMIAKQGQKTVSIPIPHIDTPRFRFSDKSQGGTGQGDGKDGEPIGGDGEGEGGGKAGEGEGDHALEVEMEIDELAEILGEELALPNIEKKGKADLINTSQKYKTIRRQGPEGLRNFKRTYKESLKREISTGTYKPGNVIVPRREDKRYKAADVIEEEITNAVVIYMMDVSGSMGQEQKEIVRLTSFWINAWLKKQYKGLHTRYIIHDTIAKEVPEDVFFHTSESGGTSILSAYTKCTEMMDKDYPSSEWNVYPFHFSDGDNYSNDDTQKSIDCVRAMLDRVNQFSYGQVVSGYGSGQFLKDISNELGSDQRVSIADIQNKDGILAAIKQFLGKGK